MLYISTQTKLTHEHTSVNKLIHNTIYRPIYRLRYAVAEWYGAVRSRGRGFESHQRLLCTNANSACHPFGVSQWVPAKAGE